MDQRLKDQAKSYDLPSLRKSLEKHDDNISTLDEEVVRQEDLIENEQMMISVIGRPDNEANKRIVEIDTAKLKDSIQVHRSEIALFKSEVKQEEARRRETEQMIMYLEAK